MSTITLALSLTFEDLLDPQDADDLRERLEQHVDLLLDHGFLERYGTIYDFSVAVSNYNADDSP